MDTYGAIGRPAASASRFMSRFAGLFGLHSPVSNSVDPLLARKLKTALATTAIGFLLLIGGGLLFIASGFYYIAADVPHLAPVRWVLRTGRTRAVEFHSRGIRNPKPHDSSLIPHGFDLHRENCAPCHGAPAVAVEQKGRRIDPIPPPLVTAGDWTDAQLY